MTTVCTAWRQATTGDTQAWAVNYKLELLESLMRAGVTDEAGMRVGLSRLKAMKKDFLPNPDAFAELCVSAEDLGLPSESDAFRLALNWSNVPARQKHPAVLAALRMLDSWQFRRMTDDQARKHWSSAWSRVVERVRAEGSGWLPDQPRDELPPGSSRSPEQIERGRAFLASVMEELSMSAKRPFDHQASPEFLRVIGK